MSLFNFDHRNIRLALVGGLLALGAGAFGGGCSGGFTYPTEAEFCNALGTVECNEAVVSTCYGLDDASIDTDTRSCVSGRSKVQHCNPSGFPYHPELADACIDAVQQLWVTGNFVHSDKRTADAACLPVFNKGGAEGARCDADTDCDVGTGLYCIQRAGTRGSCRIPKAVSPGDRCNDDPSKQCQDNDGSVGAHYCEEAGSCVATPAVNEKCGEGMPCSDGLRCDSEKNVCRPQAKNGSQCSSDDQCEGGFCLGTSGSGAKGLCSSQFRLDFATTCSAFR